MNVLFINQATTGCTSRQAICLIYNATIIEKTSLSLIRHFGESKDINRFWQELQAILFKRLDFFKNSEFPSSLLNFFIVIKDIDVDDSTSFLGEA